MLGLCTWLSVICLRLLCWTGSTVNSFKLPERCSPYGKKTACIRPELYQKHAFEEQSTLKPQNLLSRQVYQSAWAHSVCCQVVMFAGSDVEDSFQTLQSPVQILPMTRVFSVIPPKFDQLWPLLRHPQLALPRNPPWNSEWFTEGGLSKHCQEGV